MSLDKGMRWKGSDEDRLRLMSEGGKSVDDMMVQLHRPKKSIRAKLRDMGLPEPQPKGVKRKCMNHARCGNTFRSKYAGLCPKCRKQPEPSRFETMSVFA